jgi:hypothetical protein
MSPKRPAKTKTPPKPAVKDRSADSQRGDGKTAEKQPRNGPRVDPDDPVEEASWESFPASDPPSFNPAPKATPGSGG